MAAAALLMAIAVTPSTAAPAKPDLTVKFSTSNGRVVLRNTGTKASKKSVVIVVCQKISGPGSCPDPHPALVAQYLNPAFPNAATVEFPAVQPGSQKVHALKFWSTPAYGSGKYRFTLVADALDTNPESNEGNNKTVVIKTVP